MKRSISSNEYLLGIGITLLSYLFFSGASSLLWFFSDAFPTIQVILIANITSLFCILPYSLRNGWQGLKTKNIHLHLIRDLMGLGSYFLFFYTIRALSFVDATVLNYTSPFFVPLIWQTWTREKIIKKVWWSIIVGFMGIAILLNPSQEIFKSGFVFGILTGIFSATASCAVKILNLYGEPLNRTLFYFFATCALVSFPFAWSVWVPPSGMEWMLAIGMGMGTAAGQICFTFAYRYGNVECLAPLAYSAVVYNCLISYFIYGREITEQMMAGTALIIIGGTFSYLWNRKPTPLKL